LKKWAICFSTQKKGQRLGRNKTILLKTLYHNQKDYKLPVAYFWVVDNWKKMLSGLEKKIMERLKNSNSHRMNFCEKIHQELVLDYDVPVSNRIVLALDQLLTEADINHPQRKGILVSGMLPTKTVACRISRHKDKDYFCYLINVCSKLYDVLNVPSGKRATRTIDCQVEIDSDKLKVVFEYEGNQYLKEIDLKGLATYKRNLKKEYFDKFVGVEVREVGKRNFFAIGGKHYTLSGNSGGSFLIIIFDKGKCYMYNLFGEMVFTSLPSGEISEQKRLEKTYKIKIEADALDMEGYKKQIREHLISEWKNGPEDFNDGRLFIVEGGLERLVDNIGQFYFTLFSDKRREAIYVGEKYAGKKIRAEVKGPYMLFYDNTELVNASKTGRLGFERIKITRPPLQDFEYLRIRNINFSKQRTYLEIAGKTYMFENKAIASCGEQYPDKSSYALMYHKGRINFRGDFELLSLNETGEVQVMQISPSRIAKIQTQSPC